MAGDAGKLASEIQTALGQKGAVSAENKALAKAILDEVKQAKCLFVPGQITGTAVSSGGPLQKGAAKDGAILALLPPRLSAAVAGGLGKGPPTPQVLAEATGICTHLMTGKVSFSSGSITGTTTNTPSNPGTVTGVGSKGKISGLDGAAMAQLIAPSHGGSVSPQLKAKCVAIVKHIQENVEVAITGVAGVASAGGGPAVIAGNAGSTFV